MPIRVVLQKQQKNYARCSLHLSRQIKDLEDYIGTPLFIRGHRQVSLTDAGKIFLMRVVWF
ncbi:LysR family transcriptional regulator [Vibrio sp. PP-XX7]